MVESTCPVAAVRLAVKPVDRPGFPESRRSDSPWDTQRDSGLGTDPSHENVISDTPFAQHSAGDERPAAIDRGNVRLASASSNWDFGCFGIVCSVTAIDTRDLVHGEHTGIDEVLRRDFWCA
jgi:hypothetical protein